MYGFRTIERVYKWGYQDFVGSPASTRVDLLKIRSSHHLDYIAIAHRRFYSMNCPCNSLDLVVVACHLLFLVLEFYSRFCSRAGESSHRPRRSHKLELMNISLRCLLNVLLTLTHACRQGPQVYVYETEDTPLLGFDVRSIYSPEQRIYASLLKHPCRTFDKAQAELFYVPSFGTFVSHRNQQLSNSTSADLFSGFLHHAAVHEALLSSEGSAYYYRRRNGTDHVFTIAHDIGSCLAPAYMARSSRFLQVYGEPHSSMSAVRVQEYLMISIANHHEATELLDRPFQFPCYDPSKDVVIPPFIGQRASLAIDELLTREQRSFKTNKYHFRGSLLPLPYSYGVRQWLEENGLRQPFLEPLQSSTMTSDDVYWRELTSSTFCLSPPGWFQWSPRTYQAIAAGCIPVLIQNKTTQLPFESSVDWSKFALILDLENYEEELRTFIDGGHPDGELVQFMQEELARVWRKFTYGGPWGTLDPSVFTVSTGSNSNTKVVAETEIGGAVDFILESLAAPK